MRSILVLALGLALIAPGLWATTGSYQRTKNGKIRIWNPNPKASDVATWSGSRDEQHYATGEGTVTWYRLERRYGLGAGMGVTKEILVVSYTGTMVRGKLEGTVVAVDADGKIFHGTFKDGDRVGEWALGSGSSEQPNTETQTQLPKSTETNSENPPSLTETENKPPASSPTPPPQKTERHVAETKPQMSASPPSKSPSSSGGHLKETEASREKIVEQALERQKQSRTANQSPEALSVEPSPIAGTRFPRHNETTSPPLSSENMREQIIQLRKDAQTANLAAAPPAEAPTPASTPSSSFQLNLMTGLNQPRRTRSSLPPTRPILTSTEVIALTDAKARLEGYSLGDYERPQAEYTLASETWTVTYKHKPTQGSGGSPRPLIVVIEEKTRKTLIKSAR